MGIIVPSENVFRTRARPRQLTKVRSAGDRYAISLEPDLSGEQELTATAPTVRVLSWASAEDRSADFPGMDPEYGTVEVAGETERCIRFWLPSAVGDAQAPGRYAIEALFETASVSLR